MVFFGSGSVVWWSEFLATDLEVRVRFSALPDFLRTSGSGKGSIVPLIQMRSYFGRKRGRKFRLQPWGIRCAYYTTHLYPQKLALTSPISGRWVGIVCSWMKATELLVDESIAATECQLLDSEFCETKEFVGVMAMKGRNAVENSHD
jgi:hypothetical protein